MNLGLENLYLMLTPKDLLINLTTNIPRLSHDWDAKECITEMKNAEYKNWRQTEWVGFYLEYLTDNIDLVGIAHVRLFVGHTTFNGCADKNIIDYKTSTSKNGVILNDKNAIDHVTHKYKELGYVIIQGETIREDNNEIDLWRQSIAGKSQYVIKGENTGRKHRKLKALFSPQRLIYVPINKYNVSELKIFVQGKNSDGNPRNLKYILPHNLIDKYKSYELDISKRG